jgi:hypothetical protein
MKQGLVLLGIFLSATVAWGKVFTETSVICNATLVATITDGDLRVYAPKCSTVDAAGSVIRVFAPNVTNRLTTAQKNATLALLGQLDSLGAQIEGVPTPAATPTVLAVSTPTATVTP